MASSASTRTIETGFRGLDALTGGFRPTDLVVVGARPGAGKSALAVGIVRRVAIRTTSPVPVAFISLDLGRDQIENRIICAEARVDQWRMLKGLLCDEERERIDRAAAVVREAPIHVDDTPSLTVLELCERARRLHAEHRVGVIVVDYLDLIRGPSGDREEQLRRTARSLKALAVELGLPVMALLNLPREVDQREDPKPRLSDLGDVVEEADLVLLLYRDGIYDPGSPETAVEVIVAKNRDEKTGASKLAWNELIAWRLDAGGVRSTPAA